MEYISLISIKTDFLKYMLICLTECQTVENGYDPNGSNNLPLNSSRAISQQSDAQSRVTHSKPPEKGKGEGGDFQLH